MASAVRQIREWVWRGIARLVTVLENQTYVMLDYAAAAERDPCLAAAYAAMASAGPRPVRYPLLDEHHAHALDCVLWQPCHADVPGIMDEEWGRGVPTVNAVYLAALLAPAKAPWPVSCVWRSLHDGNTTHAIRTLMAPDGSFCCKMFVDGRPV